MAHSNGWIYWITVHMYLIVKSKAFTYGVIVENIIRVKGLQQGVNCDLSDRQIAPSYHQPHTNNDLILVIIGCPQIYIPVSFSLLD